MKESKYNHGFDSDKNYPYESQQHRLPPGLLNKLSAYIMKSKSSLTKTVKDNPLILTGTEAEITELKKKEQHVMKLIREYNLSSRTAFQKLPSEAQTVLFSLTYQYGIDKLKTTFSDVWMAALNQDWAFIHELLDQAGVHVSRRRNEAELIRKII